MYFRVKFRYLECWEPLEDFDVEIVPSVRLLVHLVVVALH